MKQKKKFVVQAFPNPSGEIVYRAYGRLNGERVRKNFATRQEAEAQCWVRRIGGSFSCCSSCSATRDLRAHVANLRLTVSPKEIRRSCARHGIRRDMRAGRPRTSPDNDRATATPTRPSRTRKSRP